MQSTVLNTFGGLNLPDDPQDVGLTSAIDLMNVDFDRRGRLRTRDGYGQVTAAEGTNRYDSLHTFYSGTGNWDTIIAGALTRLEAIDPSDGSVDATSTAATASPHRFVTFGGSSGTAVYIANGTDGIRKYTTGGGFTSPAGLAAVTGKFLAVQTPDNRLVSAKGSRVSFSGAGTPETFGANDWVDVTPGDGESIVGLVSWNHLLFAFKETKFAVFTGNSTDGTGGSIFNYRVVQSPSGVGSGLGGALAAAAATPDGVVFADTSGVYLTTGGPPVLISDGLKPLFDQDAPQYSTVSFMSNPWSVVSVRRKVFVTYSIDETFLGSDLATFVYDLDAKTWTVWDIPAKALAVIRNNAFAPATVLFADATGTRHIHKFGSDETTDNGSAISWWYQSGFGDLGVPEAKRVPFASVWGTGSVTLQMAVDHGVPDTGGALTLGMSPGTGEARQSVARRGRLLSFRLSGSGQAVVNRLGLYIADSRLAGVR